MRLDELKQLAQSMGIGGISKMRKVDLVAAIRAARAEANGVSGSRSQAGELTSTAPSARRAVREEQAAEAPTEKPQRAQSDGDSTNTNAAGAPAGDASDNGDEQGQGRPRTRRGRRGGEERPKRDGQNDGANAQNESGENDASNNARNDGRGQRDERRDGGKRDGNESGSNRGTSDQPGADKGNSDKGHDKSSNERSDKHDGSDKRDRGQGNHNERRDGERGDKRENRENRDNNDRSDKRDDRSDKNERDGGQRGGRNERNNNGNNNDDDERGGRRRRQRGRDRDRSGRRGGRGRDFEDEAPEIREDDVLVPVAGIVDVLDNYAFVRTTGYLSGPTDVYVPMNLVKKNALRKGDAVTGAVRALREGEQLPARQKFNALVRLDTVNGMTVDAAKKRVEFGKLTPLYPQERLRLETRPNVLTTRIIDLVAPIGKGQRGLIVAPAKAGKTMVMQSIANAITTNNPECHLMVVLVDERPEEVTDMQRAVKGEVIASTFDRPATDHTTVAELAIERAKRLVEMGHDVVVLLDSITKLGRAYNLAAPASGRILSGGVDSAALYPPKKFFGAARNIENGGSLTILATALVETGSRMDEVIFEEFKGTGNMELKLDRGLANRRIFPAVDINASGTRREEILLSAEELKIMWKLRRVLAALDQQQGIELLIDRLKKTKHNVEFLMQVQQTSNIKLDDDED
ncbi:transcription termination factor Rho [Dermacoccus abyssi]|uniref:transcription termination factor Rho n=1 Tax=Dermacoccus abyssi TaxID=322596 RepID=UPI0037EE6FF5|nr:transcription termination factor Rho [Dermacoccus abyssi]